MTFALHLTSYHTEAYFNNIKTLPKTGDINQILFVPIFRNEDAHNNKQNKRLVSFWNEQT